MDKPCTTSVNSSPEEMKNPTNGESQAAGQTLVGLLKAFTQETSMHGLGRVLSSRYLWLRGIWAVCVLAGAGIAAFNVIKVIMIYSTYPVATVVTLEYASAVQFPAVTICNLNMLRKIQWDTNVQLVSLKSGMDGFTDQDSTTQAKGQNSTGDYIEYSRVTLDDAFAIRMFMATQDKDVRREFGHQIEDMLLYCYYNVLSCTAHNFTDFYTPEFGNCFTFNKLKGAITVTKPGPAQGLELLLNVEEEEYMPLSTTTGFKVVIHPQDTMPFPEDEGVMVTPGFTTNIAISKRDIERTEPPYGRCVNYGKNEQYELNMYSREYDVGYSDKMEVYGICGCCDRDYPCHLISSAGEDLKAKYCNFSNDHDVLCVTAIRDAFKNDGLGCGEKCHPACKETSFTTEVSTGRWPSISTEDMYVEQLKRHRSSIGKNIDLDHVRFNIARLNIYFKQLNYQLIQTTPAYDWSRLLSDLGGQFGLWLGFSLLTALEIVQLMFDMCERVAKRLFWRHSGKTAPENTAASLRKIR